MNTNPLHWTLHRIRCEDDVVLTGLLSVPEDSVPIAGRTALVFVGGLTSSSLQKMELLETFARVGAALKTDVLGLDTRGAYLASHVAQLDPTIEKGYRKLLVGTGFEHFEDCRLDLRAACRFLRELGYARIVLAGHSTGANKACYTLGMGPIEGVVGAALLGPASDVGTHSRTASAWAIHWNLKRAARMVHRGEGDSLLPLRGEEGIYSAARYLSLFTPGGAEDTFPSHDKHASFAALSKISVPLFLCFGEQEEHLVLPVTKDLEILKNAATASPAVTTQIIPGATHGFREAEQPLAEALFTWMQTLS